MNPNIGNRSTSGMITYLRFCSYCLFSCIALHQARADGFSLRWATEHEAHIVIQLSPEQTATVGRERKLLLTPSQRKRLANFTKNVPEILGVESLGEPDCSCCISSALWTDTHEVTIWIRRLAQDKNGSRAYYEVRQKPGYYTADAAGRIYAAGKPVAWEQFEKMVLAKKKDEYIQLSLPPKLPKGFATRIQRLEAKMSLNRRL